MPTSAPSRRRSVPALLAVLTLLLAACGGSDDPSQALADAFERTFGDSLAYELSLDADPDALSGLAEDAGQVGALLGGVTVDGVLDDGAATVRISGLGSTLLELRSLDEGELLYARLGIQDLLAMAGGGDLDPAQLLALAGVQVAPEVEAALVAGLAGDWVAIEGGLDEAMPTPDAAASDAEGARQLLADVFGGDLQGFFERFVSVTGEDRGDALRTIEVSFELREFLRTAAELDDEAATADLEADLAELPERIPGVVSMRDGLITELRFELAEPLREAGAEVDGDVDLVVEISDHGAVEPVVAPEDAITITAEQLEQALASLGAMGSGVLP